MDNYNSTWVWYAAGILAFLAIAGFLLSHFYSGGRLRVQEEAVPMEV